MIDLEELAAAQMAKKADQREQNRRDFPYTATVMDALAIFKPRLIWAEENGRSIGRERD